MECLGNGWADGGDNRAAGILGATVRVGLSALSVSVIGVFNHSTMTFKMLSLDVQRKVIPMKLDHGREHDFLSLVESFYRRRSGRRRSRTPSASSSTPSATRNSAATGPLLPPSKILRLRRKVPHKLHLLRDQQLRRRDRPEVLQQRGSVLTN